MSLFLRAALALLLAASMPLAHAQVTPQDLPPVDSVFVPSLKAVDRGHLEIHWTIAKGYYLYRHRMGAQVLGDGVQAGTLSLPEGAKHHDEFFGDVQTYRDGVTATLPVTVPADANGVSVRIKYQGCADVGVCYPPQTRTLAVALPAASGGGAVDPGFAALGRALAGGAPAATRLGDAGNARLPLPPEQAFRLDAIADGGSRLLLRLTPAKGYYAYRDKLKLRVSGAQGVALGAPEFPPAQMHRDEHFGNVPVYFNEIEIPVPLVRTARGPANVTLDATLQGCQDDGICYQPMRRSFHIALPAAEATTRTQATVVPVVTPAPVAASVQAATLAATAPQPGTASLANSAALNATPGPQPPAMPRPRIGLLAALLLALGGGLILNLMPCVLPVLSLKALSLAQAGEDRHAARRHALGYTAGVLLAFLTLGGAVLALRNGGHALGWGFQLQSPHVVAALALLMFALGLNLSGLWHANVAAPMALQAGSQRRGMRGDLLTGVLAVVLATPCTAPFMGAALAYAFVAPTVSALLVFAMLGIGLALPVALLAWSPTLARRLPRPGAWMDTFKQLMAFPMYATAAWLLWVLAGQRGADAVGLCALAAVLLALALWAWTHARSEGPRWAYALAVLALIGSVATAVAIGRLPKPALQHADAGSSTVPYSPERLAALRAQGAPVFVDVTADWCVTCKANERAVFSRQGFRDALAATGATYMVADNTNDDPAIDAFMRANGAVGLPLYVVYPRNGGPGVVLPTLLTPTLARRALEDAAR